MIDTLAWLPEAIVFLFVASGSFGMYLMFKRRGTPVVASTTVSEKEAAAACDQAFAASKLPPKMAELQRELRSAGVYEPKALAEYTSVRAAAALCVLACT